MCQGAQVRGWPFCTAAANKCGPPSLCAQGIVFSVRPPKKSWKHIANLSGGEKTLSSLSLVFALHHYKPTPLYVMDEIDAALDFKNVSIGVCGCRVLAGCCLVVRAEASGKGNRELGALVCLTSSRAVLRTPHIAAPQALVC